VDQSRHDRNVEVFLAARGLSGADRAAYLETACAGNAMMRVDVESLLAADGESFDVLDDPEAMGNVIRGSSRCLIGHRIGQYELLRQIGTGGMGTIYEAQQRHPDQIVALKLMRRGAVSPSAIARFEHESQVLASLRHPNIAQVHEAGSHDDGDGALPYFVMEYVPDARSITQYAHESDLSQRKRVELFVTVCEAIHHGHQRGIIHRDIKPDNILVDPDGFAKIIDFGIARATDSDLAFTTVQTNIGQVLGTLQYMSPEQLDGDTTAIDVRTDVYALGVVLYELLADRLPYDITRHSLLNAARLIKEQAPPRLSSIDRRLRGDIETIVGKTLEKNRERRYQSADHLCRDLRRFLAGESISARPPSLAYHIRVTTRRHKGLTAGVAAAFLILVGATILSTSLYLNAKAARSRSESMISFLLGVMATIDPDREGEDATLRAVINRAAGRIDDEFADEPIAQARLRQSIGWWYYQLAELDTAEMHLARALELYDGQLGTGDIRSLNTALQLARVYHGQGRFEPAEGLYHRSMRRQRGSSHRETQVHLAQLYVDMERFVAALPLQEQISQDRARSLGPTHVDTYAAHIALARTYERLGQWTAAATRLEELYDSAVDSRGVADELTRTIAGMIAALLERHGLSEDAVKWAQRR